MGTISNLKSLIYSTISKGRAGFPKPLSSGGRIGLSANSKQLSLTLTTASAQIMSQISNAAGNSDVNATTILALRSRLVRESITLDSGNVNLSDTGSSVDTEA